MRLNLSASFPVLLLVRLVHHGFSVKISSVTHKEEIRLGLSHQEPIREIPWNGIVLFDPMNSLIDRGRRGDPSIHPSSMR
jgi:hypothetical protein